MNSRGIKHRHGNILLTEQQRNLSAPKDNAFGPTSNELRNNVEVRRLGGLSENITAELLFKRLLDEIPSSRLQWNYGFNAVRPQLVSIERQLHGEFCSDQAYRLKARSGDLGRCRRRNVNQR